MFNYFIDPFFTLKKNREIIFELSKRDITDKYKGQALGVFWAFGHPLVLVLIYVFLFAGVFKVNVGTSENSTLSYTVYILSGLIPWITFQTAMITGAASILNNSAFVRQSIFPLEAFPIKCVGSSVIVELIYFCFIYLYIFLSGQTLTWSFLLMPIVVVLQTMTLIGINYFLSSFGTYFRDLKDFVQVFCSMSTYIMPILYLPEAVPAMFKPILYVNPFSYYIWVFQDVLYYGRIIHPYAWIVVTILSFLLFFTGYHFFEKLKHGFGSVL